MQTTIKLTEKVAREIRVELPYFYKQDLSGDRYNSTLYGCICEDITYEITVTIEGRAHKCELEFHKTNLADSACYFSEQFKSHQREFTEARNSAWRICRPFNEIGK